jgi:hypothetical protein
LSTSTKRSTNQSPAPPAGRRRARGSRAPDPLAGVVAPGVGSPAARGWLARLLAVEQAGSERR